MAAEAATDLGRGTLPVPPDGVFEGQDVENYLSEVTRDFMRDIDGFRRGIGWAVTFFSLGDARTIAAASPHARDTDLEQCSFADGPVIQAMQTGEFVLVSELSADRRWPGYASAASGHGVQSLLSVPIVSTGGASAAINLYSSFAHTFSSDDIVRAMQYAREVGRALRVVVRVAGRAEAAAELVIARSSLALVDLALRSLVREYGLTPDGALQYLRTAAVHGHTGLHDVALNVVVSAGQPAQENQDIRELNPAVTPARDQGSSTTERAG